MSMRGRQRRKKFEKYRKQCISEIIHQGMHSRNLYAFGNYKGAATTAGMTGICAMYLVKAANKLTDKDWEFLT